MRIVFIDIQNNNFIVKTLRTLLLKSRIGTKYAEVFKELLNHEEVRVCNYITRKGASMLPQSLDVWIGKCLAWLEYWIMLKPNKIVGSRIKLLTHRSSIKADDIVISFIHSYVPLDELERIRARKILHINQFCYHPIHIIRDNKVGVSGYMGEANLVKISGYFQDNCPDIRSEFLLIPYSYANRFKRIKPFSARLNKALATGTIAECGQEDFQNYYKTKYLHGHMRKDIYAHQQELLPWLDSVITPFEETDNKNRRNRTHYFWEKCYAYWQVIKHPTQKKYFSFNIVEKYNNYKMCVVPEEIIGMPAIGTFEGMACGCAAVALDHKMYRDLGLLPGIHYIDYDGSLDSLKDRISYYQQHEDELEEIADNGYEFVRTHFTASDIARQLVENLKVMYNET